MQEVVRSEEPQESMWYPKGKDSTSHSNILRSRNHRIRKHLLEVRDDNNHESTQWHEGVPDRNCHVR